MNFKTNSLTPAARAVLCEKATEPPFSESPQKPAHPGTWLCRQCGLALFRSQARFDSGCGWPAFNRDIPGAVKEQRDEDGVRDEILCARCEGHLGHVFRGEGLTPENLRHCVNALSLDFVSHAEVLDSEEAILAAGCFWGVEYLFKKYPGVLKTEVGYTGGRVFYPTYEQVCRGDTGHYEALRVLYDLGQVSYADIIRYFYEIHHPEERDGQGPDRGPQYRSAVFFHDAVQQKTAEEVTDLLKQKGFSVATQLKPTEIFWPAEEYHQDYYGKNGKAPYCHFYTKKF